DRSNSTVSFSAPPDSAAKSWAASSAPDSAVTSKPCVSSMPATISSLQALAASLVSLIRRAVRRGGGLSAAPTEHESLVIPALCWRKMPLIPPKLTNAPRGDTFATIGVAGDTAFARGKGC
ncbi:unnamed protein product, partial [Ectocarpus fasciculatus]